MKQEVANILLQLGCVQISPKKPFQYASGAQGPIYCDNRKVISHPRQRAMIVSYFWEKIQAERIGFDQLAGLATAGIPHAAFLAHARELPMVYVRSKPKGHGKGNQVEGDFQAGQSLLLIEDLINQASSLESAVQGVRQAGLKVDSGLAIVSYQTAVAQKRAKSLGLNLYSLTDFDALVQEAIKLNLLAATDEAALREWQKDPVNWSPAG